MYARTLTLPKRSFFLFGPRGTGTTTWLRSVLPRNTSLWFDLILDRELLRLTRDGDRFTDLAPDPSGTGPLAMCSEMTRARRLTCRLAWTAALIVAAGASPGLAAPDCTPVAGSHSAPFAGKVREGQRLALPVGPYQVRFEPNEFGWRIQVASADGDTLPVVVPPTGTPQPQPGLLGFLYRNSDNTGPSPLAQAGAPVPMRLWFGTQATDPTINPELVVPGRPDPAPRGEIAFELLNYELADLAPGQRARMVYAEFAGCLSWPATADAGVGDSLAFLPEEIETFGKCGLDLKRYTLSALFAPRILDLDIDGDDAHDYIAAVTQGERRGVAICRAGTYLTLLGFGSAGPELGFEPAFLPALEAWRVVPAGVTTLGYEGEPPWPDADGDILLLERIEKAAVLLFMRQGKFAALRLYRYVEP